MCKNDHPIVRILCVVLLGVVIFQISSWGYLIARYVLSTTFGVPVEATIYEALIGIVAIVSSIGIFFGAFHAWRLDMKAVTPFLWGGIGFLIKNLLDIFNAFVRFSRFADKTPAAVNEAALEIGFEVLQAIFWIFVLWYFSPKRFAQTREEWLARPAPAPRPPSSAFPPTQKPS